MNCFSIESNHEINRFFNDFYKEIGKGYKQVAANFNSCKLEKVAGWPCPDFDLTMLYLSIGYDHHHPFNRHREIERQKGIIEIKSVKYEFEFWGSQNVIDRFRLPISFHKSFEYDKIYLEAPFLPITVNNRRAKKKFKHALKKDLKEYAEIINLEDLFITQIGNKNYLSIVEFQSNRFLTFDRKYNSFVLDYSEPDWLEDNENQYRNFEERSNVISLNVNINEILKGIQDPTELKQKIGKIASR